MYMYICIYTYICMYIYVYIYMCIYIHTHMYVHVYIPVKRVTKREDLACSIYTYIYIYKYIYTYTHTHVCICIYTGKARHQKRLYSLQYIYIYIYKYTHACMYIYAPVKRVTKRDDIACRALPDHIVLSLHKLIPLAKERLACIRVHNTTYTYKLVNLRIYMYTHL